MAGKRDRTRDRGGELEEGELVEAAEPQPKKKKEEMDPLLTRTGQTHPLSCPKHRPESGQQFCIHTHTHTRTHTHTHRRGVHTSGEAANDAGSD